VLVCRGAETDACLTEPQIATVRGLYAGNASADGQPLLRGYSVGAEEGLEEAHYVSAPESEDGSFGALNPFWRDLVFEDPKWDYRSFDLARDGALAQRKLAAVLDAVDPDLTRFSARGGKLILFHGWADPLPPPLGSIAYVERVARTMGAERADRTVRLFMAPGMGHCAGGDGPSRFGQFGVGDGNPETSLGAALQRWVEQGVAPDRVIATKRKNDGDATSEVLRTRPLCAYPKVARYAGSGNTDDAESFVCAAPR
jgi:Tannase and feruloyl esterase